MKEWKSLSHVEWECKHHIVFASKYRHKTIYGKTREKISGIIKELVQTMTGLSFWATGYCVSTAGLDEEGIVDKIMGDAVMAIFGLLPACLSPSMQSVNAGFRIIENLAVLNDLRKTENCFTLDVGVGIASGPVILGILGSKDRRTLSAIGHHVNLASRLESQAPPGKFSETKIRMQGHQNFKPSFPRLPWC